MLKIMILIGLHFLKAKIPWSRRQIQNKANKVKLNKLNWRYNKLIPSDIKTNITIDFEKIHKKLYNLHLKSRIIVHSNKFNSNMILIKTKINSINQITIK